MNNIIISKENNFKEETINSYPVGINNIMLETDTNTNTKTNSDLKKNNINSIKPMLSGGVNKVSIPNGKKVKIRPVLAKKSLSNTFGMISNNKKKSPNSGGDGSVGESMSGIDEISDSSGNSYKSETDDILSNNSNNSMSIKYKNNDDDDDDDNDNSTIGSKSRKNKTNSTHEEDEWDGGNGGGGGGGDDGDGDDDDEDDEDEDDEDDNESDNSSVSVKKKQKTYEEIQQEKQKLLFNLERLQKQGYPPSKKYSMASSFDDMQFEHDRLKKQRDVEKSIKFSRKILMACISGVEFLNNKFDPFDVRLDGWSENIMENVTDYDEVFEELHEKYGESVKMAPELKLLGLVCGSAFMFHLTNSLFKSASPNLSDILKQNPDIMKNISEAAAKNVNNTIDKEFGQDDILSNLMKGGINSKASQSQQQPQQQPQQQRFPVGPSGPSRPSTQQGPKLQQTKMNGPTGIDDLLDELNGGGNSNIMKDNMSVSSSESVTIKSSAKRTKNSKKGGIQLDLR